MDFYYIAKKLNEASHDKTTFINMFVKYTDDTGTHTKTFANEKEYDNFCKHIMNEPSVTHYECSKVFKKVTE